MYGGGVDWSPPSLRPDAWVHPGVSEGLCGARAWSAPRRLLPWCEGPSTFPSTSGRGTPQATSSQSLRLRSFPGDRAAPPMAEKGPCPGLDASLRSEDLLSDMEPLPLSAPATPAQPFGSEVTAQLYTSLRRSRQAELDACSQLQPPDLDALAEELNRTLSVGVEASARRKGGESRHVAEMETVRSHLRTMLQDSRELPSAGGALGLGLAEQKDDDSFESDSTTALLAARPLQELSPPGSVCGLEELFPRYASLRLGTPPEPAPATEPQLLKEALAKERARRKHCERHVQGLQSRALELQQQLAAAISADMKKDSMIEQLDKTLAKVVEGWNRQEAERTELLRGLQAEKEAVQRALSEQQETASQLEVRLEQALEALSREQQAASQQREEAALLQEEKAGLLRSLEAERQRGGGLQVEREHGQRQLEALRATLEEQQASWAQRECQLEQRCQALQDESARQLEREKAAVQREAQRAADAQQVLASVQADAQRLESELEAARSERDGLQMEISLVKARCEAQKAKLEAELKVALEQQVTERLARVHEDSLRQTGAMREQHRKQLLDLSGHHERELGSQLAQFRAELAEREERQRRLVEDYELRLARQEELARELQAGKWRLEAQRADMVARLQAMMQSHWNEALRVLTGDSSSQSPAKGPRQPSVSDATSRSEPERLGQPPSLAPPGKPESWQEDPCSGAGDGDGGGWAFVQAVPLQPVTQRSSLPVARGPERFLPLAPSGCVSVELAQLLNQSLRSQRGFQPLEPQLDDSASPGLSSHPPHLAEHPYPEDEGGPSDGETPPNSSLESGGQVPPSQLHPELQYYMALLLEQMPSDPPRQEGPGGEGQAQPHTHPGLAREDPPSLWETLRPHGPQRATPTAAVQKTKVPLAKASYGQRNLDPPSPPQCPAGGEGGVLSPRQMAEVSRLLRLYQAKGRVAPSSEELFTYLRSGDSSGPDVKGDGGHVKPAARRNLDPRLPEAGRREVGPPRRPAGARPGPEKTHGAAKGGRKAAQLGARTGKGGGVWR
ncbi:centrobin isoform X4 [Malaclemys terrapin pileata]|uniref:centrobin isoform X4 n=1 Tax=Malaclemys terrapin pileata TaxID=2991368 RepID=UPI0023A881E5|nr:centrobin isoform X4 [Malaclemys terrapin pileata]